jgi:hypothetical protein
MVLQLRKKEHVNIRDRFYSPERDIAHIGPGVMKLAMALIGDDRREPWLDEFMEANNVSLDDLGVAAEKLARACNRIMSRQSPKTALDDVGFFTDLPTPVIMIIFAKLGQSFFGAIWAGIKDVNTADSEPPADIQDLIEMAHEAAQSFKERS